MNQRIAQVVVAFRWRDHLISDPQGLVRKGVYRASCRGPFGFRRLVGFVVGLRVKSQFKKLKNLSSVLDNLPVLGQGTLISL